MNAFLSILVAIRCAFWPCRQCPPPFVDFGSPHLAICELPVAARWIRGPRDGWVDASPDEISFVFERSYR